MYCCDLQARVDAGGLEAGACLTLRALMEVHVLVAVVNGAQLLELVTECVVKGEKSAHASSIDRSMP